MEQGKFICCPGYKPQIFENAWRHMVFNARTTQLPSGDGLQTFKKAFKLKEIPTSAMFKVTSLGLFDAFFNGSRIGGDDRLAPTWTDYRCRVFEYEYNVLPFLKKKEGAENIISARISRGWWSGRISFGFYGFKSPAFCAELILTYRDGSQEIIATDESWLCTIAGPVLNADIWDGEFFDARIPDPATVPNSCEWTKASLFTDYTCKIVPFEGAPVKVNEKRSPISAWVWSETKDNGSTYGEIRPTKQAVGEGCEATKLKAGHHLTVDFGQNIVGTPRIIVKATNGTKIEGLVAEMLNDSGEESRGNDGPKGSIYIKNYRTACARFNYIASANANRRQLNIYSPTFTFFGCRYFELTADQDIDVLNIEWQIIGSELEPTGTFSCSDPEINKLYSNIVWGMKGNYLSVPTDCPQRDERLGWTGDTQVFSRTASYLADTNDFLTKWLGDMRDSQVGFDGNYAYVCPRVFDEGNAAAWSDAGLIVTDTLYTMYGNTQVVADQWDSMESYMVSLSKETPAGPQGTFGDWLNYEKTPADYVAACCYIYDASLMIKFARILGKKDREAFYSDLRSALIKDYENKYLTDGEVNVKTQGGYLLPLAYDIISGETQQKAIRALSKKIVDNDYTLSTGFIGTSVLNQTLSKFGLDNLAYSLLLQTRDPSWLYSVRQGASTIWERWNSYTLANGFGDVHMNSFNHYAYGVIAEWLYSVVGGIRPDPENPGFESSCILAPVPDTRKNSEIPSGQHRITNASATYRKIESNWRFENGTFIWNCTIPRGMQAKVEFPLCNGGRKVNINGLWFTAKQLGGTCENGKICFTLGEGTYTLR